MSKAQYTYAVARIRALRVYPDSGGKRLGRSGNLGKRGSDPFKRGRENLGDHPGDGCRYVCI